MKLNIYEEASRCLLCEDAPCTRACQAGDPARAIRAIRFDNHKPALRWVKDCTGDDLQRAEGACIHPGGPVRIKELVRSIGPDDVAGGPYPDLRITFCGIPCENPFFLASSAPSASAVTSAGWSAPRAPWVRASGSIKYDKT